MPRFGKKSKERLATCEKDLQMLSIGYPIDVILGL